MSLAMPGRRFLEPGGGGVGEGGGSGGKERPVENN